MQEKKSSEERDDVPSKVPDPPSAEKQDLADGEAIAEVGDAVGGPA